MEADAAGPPGRPRRGMPLAGVRDRQIARADVVPQPVEEFQRVLRHQFGLQTAGQHPPECRHQRRGRELEPVQRTLYQRPDAGVTRGVADQHAGQRADLHGDSVVARCLQPRVLPVDVEMGEGWLGAGVVRGGLALPRSKRGARAVARLVAHVVVAEPRVGDGLGYPGRVERFDRRQVRVPDDPAGKQTACLRPALGLRCLGEIPEHHVRAQPGAVPRPLGVAGGYRVQIRQEHLVDEIQPPRQQLGELRQRVVVDRLLAREVDRGCHAADDIGLRMRILAAEKRVNPDIFTLEIQRVKIVTECQQVQLRAQPIGGMPPVSVRERPDVPARQECPEPSLYRGEQLRARARIVRDRLGERGGTRGVGLQRRGRVDPVQRLQVVEVHDMIVDEQRRSDDLTQQPGVARRDRADGVLDGPHRGQRVHGGADTADPLCEQPGVPRVPAFDDRLDAAPHRRGRVRLGDPAGVYLHLDAQMTLDPGHRVDNQPAHVA